MKNPDAQQGWVLCAVDTLRRIPDLHDALSIHLVVQRNGVEEKYPADWIRELCHVIRNIDMLVAAVRTESEDDG